MPVISKKHKVCVICEGLEEHIYFNHLLNLNVWSSAYDFIPINAKGEAKIFARFQDAYINDSYEVIIIFCDTDKKPHKEYSAVKKKVNDFFNKRNAAQKIILWANPCSMQIILSHFSEVHLINQSKKTNSGIIENLTGVKDYDGHEDQIKAICNKIFRRTYTEMKERLRNSDYDDEESGTSNAVIFFDLFECDNPKWIIEIKKYLES